MKQTITITSELHAPADVIWERLGQVETLQKIARPFAYFTPMNDTTQWQPGAMYCFGFRVFGLLPMGHHHINVVRWDKANWHIETHENDRIAKVWNHTIRLEPLTDQRTRYTDIVELDAGTLTWLVKGWSILFYRHRQRGWKRLLRQSMKGY